MMNIQELATAAEHQLNIKIILMNNQALGMVHQQQDLFLKTAYLLQLIRIKRIYQDCGRVWSANLRFK